MKSLKSLKSLMSRRNLLKSMGFGALVGIPVLTLESRDLPVVKFSTKAVKNLSIHFFDSAWVRDHFRGATETEAVWNYPIDYDDGTLVRQWRRKVYVRREDAATHSVWEQMDESGQSPTYYGPMELVYSLTKHETHPWRVQLFTTSESIRVEDRPFCRFAVYVIPDMNERTDSSSEI